MDVFCSVIPALLFHRLAWIYCGTDYGLRVQIGAGQTATDRPGSDPPHDGQTAGGHTGQARNAAPGYHRETLQVPEWSVTVADGQMVEKLNEFLNGL